MESDKVTMLEKYRDLFPEAWKLFVKDMREGKIYIPYNEKEMQCHLFTKCLQVMEAKNIEQPYEIFAEDTELTKGFIPDITLGYGKADKNGVAGRYGVIELKHYPSTESMFEDIAKLRRYFELPVGYCYFAMICKEGNESKLKEVLKSLNIRCDGKSLYKIETVDHPVQKLKVTCLLVSLVRDSASSN